MEEISATSLKPASNKSLTDANANREIFVHKPSDFQHLSPVGPQADITVPQRGRKPKRNVPEPQQQMCDQEKDTVPLRPLRRKDSLTPDRKQKSDGLSVKLFPVPSVGKDATGEVISTQPAIFLSCNINKGDSRIPLGEPQKEYAQEKVGAQVTPYTGELRQKVEAESVQISMDVVPPPRVKRRDDTFPPETPQRTAPCKPLRRKDNSTRETAVSKTNDQNNLKAQVSSTLKASDPDPPQPSEKSYDVSDVLEPLQSFDNLGQTATEMIPLQPVGRKDQTTTNLFLQEELVCSKGTEQISCTQEFPKKDNNTSVQASSHVIPPSETKGIESIALKTEIFHVDQTSSLSIIQRICLPHGKRWTSSKSARNDSDKGIMAQNSNVANMECVKPPINTVMGDMEEIQQSNIVGDTAVDATNITFFQKSEDASEIAEAQKQKQTRIGIPRPRMRKRLSGSFPEDVTAIESTSKASHGGVAQGARPDGPSFISSTTKELLKVQHSEGFLPLPLGHQPSVSAEEVAHVMLRRSRFNIESTVQVEDDDISEKTPGALSLPVPKPRIKKRLSGSFPGDITISASPPPCLSDTAADTIDNESVQQNGQSGLPVPLPRAKKGLSATYSDSTPHVEGLFPLQKEFSQKTPEEIFIMYKETKEGSISLDSSVISEGGFVTIQGEDDISSELEREVLAAMAEEEFAHADSVEDTDKALDEIIEGWTFTDKPVVTDDLEKDAMSEEAEIEKVLEAEVNRSLAADDWLHVVNDKDNELKSRKEMRDEELDFGFVSVDVAAGSLKEER